MRTYFKNLYFNKQGNLKRNAHLQTHTHIIYTYVYDMCHIDIIYVCVYPTKLNKDKINYLNIPIVFNMKEVVIKN